MGRAVILENLGDAQYKIEYRMNAEAIQARIEEIETELGQLDDRKDELGLEMTAALAALAALDAQLATILRNTTLSSAEKDKQGRAVTAQQRQQRSEIIRIESEIAGLDATRLALSLKQTGLQRVETTQERTVWSADYAPDLGIAGQEIATIEVPGDDREILLTPSNNQFRGWDPQIDGDMTPVIAQTPMQWLYNTCVVTGWQKYRPTYRFAKILEIKSNKLVTLEIIEPFTSLYGNELDVRPLNPDQSPVSYAEVPVKYLDCNAVAFKVGDEVLVQYLDQQPGTPQVIGFRRAPEPCAAINIYHVAGERLRFSTRLETWSVRPMTGVGFGSCYWCGEKEAVSWHGWRTRYLADGSAFLPSLYHRGQDYGPLPGPVLGGCIRAGSLFAVCRVGNSENLYSRSLVGSNEKWVFIEGMNASPWGTLTPWYFSASGQRAASAKFTSAGTQLVTLTVSEIPPWVVSITVAEEVLTVDTVEGGTVVTTTKGIAVDYSGESLVTFDRRSEFRQEFFTGGFDEQETTKVYFLCASPHLEYLIHSMQFTLASRGINLWRDTYTLSTPHALDHLNVTGGSSRIVSVTREITGTYIDDWSGADLDSSVSVQTSQQISISNSAERVHLPSIAGHASAKFFSGGGTPSDGFYDLVELFFNAIPPQLSHTACDRAGHVLCGAELNGKTVGLPDIPASSKLLHSKGTLLGMG